MLLTTARDCADRWGVSYDTARRILASIRHVDRDPTTGAMRYDRAEADAARQRQPGRGHRSDLATPAMPAEDAQRLMSDESIPAAHRAAWRLMWESELRVGDVLSLDVRDVDLDKREVTRSHPKIEGEALIIPISDEAADGLRAVVGRRKEGPLLTNERGRAMSREHFARITREAGASSVHAFRRARHAFPGERPVE
ncbi:tyrosine-type recombinase/integrase [Streptomyces spectabilis]|uniref:tyrosine-type recombinase/integrase n=1 Tax=Streptomyces spectabilis TaxID=68270 RepID=UPI00340A9901